MPLSLRERLEKYRMVLKQLDGCVEDLYAHGWFGEGTRGRIEKLVDDEAARVNRALGGAIATPPPPQRP
jgi:hypothetical protein